MTWLPNTHWVKIENGQVTWRKTFKWLGLQDRRWKTANGSWLFWRLYVYTSTRTTERTWEDFWRLSRNNRHYVNIEMLQPTHYWLPSHISMRAHSNNVPLGVPQQLCTSPQSAQPCTRELWCRYSGSDATGLPGSVSTKWINGAKTWGPVGLNYVENKETYSGAERLL